jgi:hypothetical protein
VKVVLGGAIVLGALAGCVAGGDLPDKEHQGGSGPSGTPLIGLGNKLESQGKCDAPTSGTAPLRRLSRLEYDNAVFDLFGVDSHPADQFVPEQKTDVTLGFNTNIGSTVSQLAAEQYLAASEQVANVVVATFPALSGCVDETDAACVKSFLEGRARRAFRGSLPASERDILLADYDAAVAEFGAEEGLRFGVQSIVLSPRFLFLLELGVEGSDSVVALTGAEVAGRLAATLWRSVPDDALLALAAEGALDTEEGVRAAADSMLSDPRSGGMLADFARQWLDVEQTPSLARDNMLWPDFTPELSRDLLTESELLFRHVVESGGTFSDLFSADYTFANVRVAEFYGLPGPTGDAFEKLTLPPERRGVLTHGSVLTAHAHFNRPSIVLRGKNVRFQLLCDPVQPPPPTVDTTLLPLEPGDTEREIAEGHAGGSCLECHKMMDPIGFGFLHFDAVGKYTPDNGEDVAGLVEKPALSIVDDVSGAFTGAAELAGKLANSQHAQQCYLIQSLRYVLGRKETEGDACSAAAAWRGMSQSGGNLKEAILSLVTSSTFRNRPRVVAGEACL